MIKTKGNVVFAVRGQWYNSDKYQVSYLRNYKSASSSIVKVLETDAAYKPTFDNRFTYFRNPYERARSIYLELQRQGSVGEKETFESYLHRVIDEGMWNKHQFPQWYYIKGFPGLVVYKQIGEVWAMLASIGGVVSVPYENKSSWVFPISKEEKKLVEKIYKPDLEIWHT